MTDRKKKQRAEVSTGDSAYYTQADHGFGDKLERMAREMGLQKSALDREKLRQQVSGSNPDALIDAATGVPDPADMAMQQRRRDEERNAPPAHWATKTSIEEAKQSINQDIRANPDDMIDKAGREEELEEDTKIESGNQEMG